MTNELLLKIGCLRAMATRQEFRGKMARVLDLLMGTVTEWPRRGIWHYPCRRRMIETRLPGAWRYRL